ncbi:hypothetical protein MKW92_027794 [Papaver armeniacum]|nr:hypothetical protein MKW92_027794 [Papaver armeniacum]
MFFTETHTLFVSIFILFFIKSQSSCNRSCGGAAKVPYPFGFSNGCEIQLNCSETEGVRIHEFKVESITNDTIVIDLPESCGRPIRNVKHLFSKNYGLTSQNGLLLGNCSSRLLHKCREPAKFVETNFDSSGCSNLSCYSSGTNGFMDFGNISQSGCKTLFSSIALGHRNSKNLSSSVSLQFQSLQLEWWLQGSCDKNNTYCSRNSDCTDLFTPSGQGFRCHCQEGFFGDGFRSGEGCRKVSSSCNPSKYMSGKCGGTTRVGVLIGGIVAGAIFMAGLALLCYCFRRRRPTFQRSHKDMKRLLSETMGSCSIPFYTYREIEKATNYFSEDNMDAWTLSSVHKVAELAFRCLAFHRDMRPSMMEVASELDYIRHSAWAPMEEGICGASSVGSTCSSVYDESDQKLDGSSVIKKVTESHRLTVSQRVNLVTSIHEVQDSSPVSVHAPWFSEDSSPSSNSLLENVVN